MSGFVQPKFTSVFYGIFKQYFIVDIRVKHWHVTDNYSFTYFKSERIPALQQDAVSILSF